MRGRDRSAKNAGPGKGHIGLGRALSKMGFCSRSEAFALIQAGRVKLSGAVTRNPEAAVRLHKDRMEVDGREVQQAQKVYWLMHKPRSLITTTEDERGRKTVYAKLPPGLPWMSPVGRLDKASEGLLLFTNDTEWAAKITAPESHLDKTYHVQIGRVADQELLRLLETGVTDKSGETLRVKRAQRIREGEKTSWIEIVLDEGKNRQIRRMLEAKNVEILRLVRVAIGPLELGTLSRGESRPLSTNEKASIDRVLREARLPRQDIMATASPR